MDALILTKPSTLTFRISAGRNLDLLNGFIKRAVAIKRSDYLFIADCLWSRYAIAKPAVEQGANLIYQPDLHHLVHAGANSPTKDVGVDGKPDEYRGNRLLDSGQLALLLRISGSVLNKLERSHQTLNIALGNHSGRFVVMLVEPKPQLMRAMFLRIAIPLRSNRIIRLFPFRKIVRINGCANVKPRAPSKHAHLSAGFDIAEASARIVLEQRCGKRLTRVDKVEPMMSYLTLGFGQLAGSNVHAAIHLHGIGTDHFTIKQDGKLLRKIGFPRCRRPDNADNGILQPERVCSRVSHVNADSRHRPQDTRSSPR